MTTYKIKTDGVNNWEVYEERVSESGNTYHKTVGHYPTVSQALFALRERLIMAFFKEKEGHDLTGLLISICDAGIYMDEVIREELKWRIAANTGP